MVRWSKTTKQKSTGAHFTPTGLANVVACRLLEYLPNPEKGQIRVLDPGCGDGGLLWSFAKCCSEELREKVFLIGVEQDPDSLHKAEQRLKKTTVDYKLIPGDFLDFVETHAKQHGLSRSLFDNVALPDGLEVPADVIIANPPYVRTQVLGSERSQELAEAFDLSGRVDLYHAFLVAMTYQLSPGGIIGVITSNRFLSTKGAASLRKFLASQYNILEIIDLGDTKLFEAAVLPAVFFGVKKAPPAGSKASQSTGARFVRIYESTTGNGSMGGEKPISAESIYEILKQPRSGQFQAESKVFDVAVGELTVPKRVSEPWMMVTDKEKAWLHKLEVNAVGVFADLADVRVGIKTTADAVFIRDDWEDLPKHLRPEDELLHPLISQEHTLRWIPDMEAVEKTKVLYTHEAQDGERSVIEMSDFPKALAYLESHRERLEGRKYVIAANRRWYEIWVPQDPTAWKQAKLVFPDISPEPKFCFDKGGIVNGNCYWITLKSNVADDILFLMQGLANSNLMTKYHNLAFNNKLYSGRRRYMTQYVEKYPIPDPTSIACREIISLVREIVCQRPSQQRVQALENQIERLVARAFGVATVADN